MLNKHRKTLLVTGLASAAVVTSLALGIWVGRSGLLDSPALSQESDRAQTRDQLIDKLEDAANQQAQNSPSPLDLFSSPFFGPDPFAQLQQMQRQMDQFFGGLGGTTPLAFGSLGAGGLAGASQPRIDIEESDHEYRVVISIAKDSEVELKTDLEDNTLAITAQIRTEQRDNAGGRLMSSTSMSQFSRAIPLDDPVDATGMKTEKSESSIVISIPKIS